MITKPKQERLSAAQNQALMMADKNYIIWARDRTLRGIGDYGLIEIAPDNATTYRTVCGLVDRGLMYEGSQVNGNVAWALTPRGRYAMQQIMRTM